MARVLLTGGRAPATLDLVRKLRAAQHTVFVAESLAWPLTRGSTAVRRSFRVPSPRADAVGFQTALRAIVARERIDLLIPTCEEIFHVAPAREALGCPVLCADAPTLLDLHSKWRFPQRAAALGLPVPETRLLESAADLRAELDRPVALKPEFSRFATATVLRPDPAAPPPAIAPTPERRWVAQTLLQGRELCSYGLAREGRLLAHVVYPAGFRVGAGSCVYFEPVEQPEITSWVERFVAGTGFSGQIAFDFVETPQGTLPLECNPRLTSGVHLFAEGGGFVEALWGEGDGAAPAASPRMLAGAMLLFCLPKVRSWRSLGAWVAAWRRARDVVYDARDPLTALTQLVGLAELGWRAWRHGVDLLTASTLDIAWDGAA